MSLERGIAFSRLHMAEFDLFDGMSPRDSRVRAVPSVVGISLEPVRRYRYLISPRLLLGLVFAVIFLCKSARYAVSRRLISPYVQYLSINPLPILYPVSICSKSTSSPPLSPLQIPVLSPVNNLRSTCARKPPVQPAVRGPTSNSPYLVLISFAEKSTWWGCGSHVPMVMDSIDESERCTCTPKVEKDGKKYPPMGKTAD